MAETAVSSSAWALRPSLQRLRTSLDKRRLNAFAERVLRIPFHLEMLIANLLLIIRILTTTSTGKERVIVSVRKRLLECGLKTL